MIILASTTGHYILPYFDQYLFVVLIMAQCLLHAYHSSYLITLHSQLAVTFVFTIFTFLSDFSLF